MTRKSYVKRDPETKLHTIYKFHPANRPKNKTTAAAAQIYSQKLTLNNQNTIRFITFALCALSIELKTTCKISERIKIKLKNTYTSREIERE